MNSSSIKREKSLFLPKHIRKLAKTILAIFFTGLFFTQAANANSQETKLTIKEKSSTIFGVCQTIENGSSYRFVFTGDAKNIASNRTVDISVEDKDIEEVLETILSNTDLNYRKLDNQIVVYKEENNSSVNSKVKFSSGQVDQQKSKQIKGEILDADGIPIIGANIIEIGTTNGTVSDLDGNFSLIVDENATLRITYIGYLEYEVSVKDKQIINIILQEDSKSLAEVVVTGYINRTKDSFTGAAETFSGEQISQISTGNILESLSSIDPSFTMMDNINVGNNPNHIPEFQIRGSTGLRSEIGYSSNNPTFILDGFEVSAEKVFDLDPSRILSITILKDASATAIYGSRAANGVVVIETKKPPVGKIRKSYIFSADVEFADLTDYNLMNAYEKLEYERLAGLYTHPNASNNEELMDIYNQKLGLISQGVNTNWISLPVYDYTISQKHSLALEGGNEELRYGLLMHYRNHEGIMKKSGRDNLGIEMQLQYLYNDFKFMNNMSFNNVSQSDSPYGSFSEYAKLNPYYNPYSQEGEINKILTDSDGIILNPLYNATLGTRYQRNYGEFLNNFSIEWLLTEALRLKGGFSFYKKNIYDDKFLPANHTQFFNSSIKGNYTKTSFENFGYDANAVLSYTKQEKRNFFNGVLIWNAKQDVSDSYSVIAEGFPNDFMDHIGMGIKYQDGSHPTGDYTISRLMGLASNFNYSYDERFLLDFSVRSDGSSIYGSEKRWGTFGSVGTGWNLHNENFIKQFDFIEELKLRASWGTTGGQNFYPFQAMMMYSYNNNLIKDISYDSYKGALLKSFGNENLQWQKTEKLNLGVDFSLWDRTLWGYINVYRNTSKSLLIDVQLAPSTGFVSYKENLGEIENKGIEGNFNLNIFKSQDRKFSWDVFTNLFLNRNRLLKINDALLSYNHRQDDDIEKSKSQSPMIRYKEGVSVNTIWANESLGIDPITGEEVFLDQNGNKVNEWSTDNYKPLGNEDPKIMGNFGTMVYYKGLQLNAYFQFRYGGDIYNQTLVNKIENVNPIYNGDKRILYDRWKVPGDNSKFKSISNRSITLPTSRFIEEFNYVNLQSISLSYTIPPAMLSDYDIENVKFSLIGNDLLRFSTVRMERGISYPFSRSISLTAQIAF